jgi:trehalose synthase-fused probable maltokinase
MGRFLTDRAAFPQTPPLVGALELLRPRGENITLAIVQGFAANQGDAWRMTLQHLRQLYSEIARSMADGATPLPVAPREGLVTLALEDNGAPPPPLPPAAAESFAAFLGSARLLGQRTAELHLALASDAEDPDFAPEPFSAEQRVALEASLTRQVDHVLPLLEENLSRIEEGLRAEARQVLDRSALVRQRLQQLRDRPMTACCIRCHGDYHLGQVLFADDDFLIIDFEGEPARPLAERRRKRPALADVAGMIRSFHYAAHAALFEGNLLETRPECEAALEVWAGHWYLVTASTFLGAYLRRAAGAPFLPAGRAELQPLLETFLLEKAVYELGYELNNRLSWVRIPLRGILGLLG